MEKKPFDKTFPYKDLPNVAETFADGIQLVQVDSSTLRILFTVSRTDDVKPGRPHGNKVTAARLVLPLPAFADLYNQLESMVTALEQRGLLQREGQSLKTTVQ